MIKAKNNIVVQIDRSTPVEYAILNPISGSFDLMSEAEHHLYQEALQGRYPVSSFQDYLLERGYFYEDQESYDLAMDHAFQEFTEEISQSQVQLLLIPTYSCNLSCVYCFQQGIDGRPTLISRETVDAFFDYARDEFKEAAQKPFITLFGGEPLMNSPAHREIISYIADKCITENYELSIVTNGYDFSEFIEILKKVQIKEIQFTLDGTEEIHDQRRHTANGKGTFNRVMSGIEAAVDNGMPVNLRTVTDRHNIEDLVKLAEVLDQKGWLDLPPALFKTQIGRNYELFECYEKPEHLFTQIEMWSEVARLAREYPVLKKFHRPDFMGIRYLVDTGELYLPSFDTCPATKTEWVFDLYGDIYGCTASCGREDFKLGSYWPTKQINHQLVREWKSRNVTNIEKCKDCSYDIICGGGCGVVAANQNGGKILSPDCRPIQELYDIGINFYADEILAYSAPEEESNQSCCSSTPISNDSSACGCQPIHNEGCMICGGELVFLNERTKVACDFCGKEFYSAILCSQGHAVCDDCHRGDILDQMFTILQNTDEKDPVKLANQLFQLPDLKMHGPEYHSLVPGVLVAAYQNIIGKKNSVKLKEAMDRGKQVVGGSCGYLGTCGACVGTGIAASVILDATPKSGPARGKANLATGYALLEVGKTGGAQCCKRDAILSILSYQALTGYYGSEPLFSYRCSQFADQPDCIGADCKFFPSNLDD